MRRVDQLADLIYQMWRQRHPKHDALADAPDTDRTMEAIERREPLGG